MNKLCLRKPKAMKNKMIVKKLYVHTHTKYMLNAQENKTEQKFETIQSMP